MSFTPLAEAENGPRAGFTPIGPESDSAPRQGFSPLAKPEPENGAVKTLRAIGQVYPAAETAANLASQAVALPVAGIAGLGTMATNAAGMTDTDPAQVIHHVGGALTYQPRTELGQHLTNTAMLPFEKLAEAGQAAGSKTLEATGSPAAATAVDTAIQALPMAIAPAAKAMKGRVKKPTAIDEGAKSPQAATEGIPGYEVTFVPDQPMETTHAQTSKPVPQGTERLASNEAPLSGARPQGFSPLRGEGDQGVSAVAGELPAVPGGPGTGAESVSLAGEAGRAGQLRAGELRVDNAARAGETSRLLPKSDRPRPGHDGGRGGETAGSTEAGFGVAATGERLSSGEPAGRQAVPGLDVADVQRRGAAPAGMGETDRPAVGSAVAEGEARLAVGESPEAVTPQPTSAKYALVEADSLKASHDSNLRPRDGKESTWNRADAEHTVQGITREFDPARLVASPDDAAGSPIVARDGTVLAGEKRSIALQRVYQANGAKADSYRQHLKDNAEALGLDPAAIDGMKKPVLVRVPDHPETLNAWAPGANYMPLVDDAKMPAGNAKTVTDLPAPIRRENILAEFARDIGTSIYEGRVKGKKLGFFRPRTEEVRIKRANDIEVAAHEVAHLIDYRVPALANAWRSDKALRQELKSVSYDHNNVQEGFAESMRLFLTQPDALQAKAPTAYAWLENFTRTHEYGPALRKAQEQMTGWFAQDALNRARSKIGTEKPLAEFFDGFWDRFRQATVDDLHGVYRMERDLKGGKLEPNGPYESARLSRASASIADGAIRYGYPVKKPDGSFTFAGKGLEEILKPVSESLDDALLYFVGRSSRELHTQGREHLFTPGEIDAMLRLATPERKAAFAEYQKWNAGILDFAEAQGVINPQARALWQRTQYLPFHRVGQPGEFKGGKPGEFSGVKALTGGTENIRDVLSNMVQNAAQLIDHAVKNESRVKIADLAEQAKGGRFMVRIDPESRPVHVDRAQVIDAVLQALGIDRAGWRAHGLPLPKYAEKLVEELESMPGMLEFMQAGMPPAGNNVVAVLRNGKPTWYEVGDPLLYRALSSIDRKNKHWLIQWLGLPKRVGQSTITLTPDFWAANMARDTIMGAVMSRSGFRPVLDSIQGMRLRMTNDPVYKEYIANGGGLSSIYLDETKLRAKLERFYTRQGIDYRTVLDTPDKLLGFIETLGDAFEMSTRLGEYKRAVASGEHPRHAAYLGREVSTDFSARGDSQALGMMYDTVMFLKPAVLSWDRLARGLAHDPNRGAIAIKAASLAMASAALYLLNRDNPEYQDLPEFDRDANWHFWVNGQHFRYPKIWEIGALSSTAERTVERTLEENPEGLGKDFARILGATFNVNLMPQIVAPLYEQATNRNSFTGAPIETTGMQDLQPFMRAKPGTSETLRALGMATADMPESLQVNPARAEALLRGYFNTWAMYGLMLSDAAFFDSQPEKRADELPVIRRFYQQSPARHTKYEQQFYDLLEESQRLRGTIKELDRQGMTEMADAKIEQPLAQDAKALEGAQRAAGMVHKEMLQVRRDPDLTPAEKRERLDELMVERNAIFKDAVQPSQQRGFVPLTP